MSGIQKRFKKFHRVAKLLKIDAHLMALFRGERRVADGKSFRLSGVAFELFVGKILQRQGQGVIQGVDGRGEFDEQARVF